MNISGIVVALAPGAFDVTLAALDALPGIRVHHHDRVGGRVVVTQEAADGHAQAQGLRLVQALRGVTHAELVYHYFDEGPDEEPEPPPLQQPVQLGGLR